MFSNLIIECVLAQRQGRWSWIQVPIKMNQLTSFPRAGLVCRGDHHGAGVEQVPGEAEVE